MAKVFLLLFLIIVSCKSEKEEKCSERYISNLEEKIKSDSDNENPHRSINLLDSLIKCGSKRKERYASKALLYWSLLERENAINSYDSALALGYDSSLIYYNRAILYSELQDSSALKDLNSLRILDPNDSLGARQLGWEVHKNLGNYTISLLYTDSLLDELQDLSYIYHVRAYNRLQLGDTLGYCQELRKGIENGLDETLNLSPEELLKPCNAFKNTD